jgi:hypothetical protein
MDNLDSNTQDTTSSLNASNHATTAASSMDVQAALMQLLAQQQTPQQVPTGSPPAPAGTASATPTATPSPQQTAPAAQPAGQPAGQPAASTPAPNLPFELSTGTQAAIQVLGAIGVDGGAVQQLAHEALSTGQPLNLAAFQQQFGNNAAYALQAAQSLLSDAQQFTQRVQQEAYSKVGGEQQWNQLTQQFKATAPHLHEAVQQLVNSNQLDAAVALMRSVVPQQGVMQPMQGALQQQVASGTPQGLTQGQFIQAVQKLRAQYPNASFETGVAGQLYNELMNRRQAGIQAGI